MVLRTHTVDNSISDNNWLLLILESYPPCHHHVHIQPQSKKPLKLARFIHLKIHTKHKVLANRYNQ